VANNPDDNLELVVDVENSHQRWQDSVPYLSTLAREVVRETLNAALPDDLRGRAIELSVNFVSDEQMHALNAEYRSKHQPTNCLSFPQLSKDVFNAGGAVESGGAVGSGGEAGNKNQPLLLGDVVVAHGVTAREAREQNKSIDHHLSHLLVHGTLHLLGYDHLQAGEAAAMESSEIEILDALGVGNPYILMDEDIKI
jgi:probable rRNA maturation factor